MRSRLPLPGLIRLALPLLLGAMLPLVAEAQSHASAPLVILAPTAHEVIALQPGAVLSISVRLSNALTPPPGIQQQRALRDWSARLVGHADLVEGNALHAYQLDVTNLRPQSGTSLDYRVEIPLPKWIAPGEYDLRLNGNGGEAFVPRSVRVEPPIGAKQAAWTAVLPLGRRLANPPPQSRWYPATNFGSTVQGPAVVAQLPGPAGDLPTIEASRSLSIRVDVDGSPRAGRTTTLRARGVPPGARVAWWFADGTTAFGSDTMSHVFEASGPAGGALLVIDSEGNAASASFEVQVQAGVRFGCDRHGAQAAGTGSGWGAMWIASLLLGVSLLKRRPRRRPGINSPPKAVGGQGQCRLT